MNTTHRNVTTTYRQMDAHNGFVAKEKKFLRALADATSAQNLKCPKHRVRIPHRSPSMLQISS
jgi:hypothetical protein